MIGIHTAIKFVTSVMFMSVARTDTEAAKVRSDGEEQPSANTTKRPNRLSSNKHKVKYERKASPMQILNFSTHDQYDKVLHYKEPLR